MYNQPIEHELVGREVDYDWRGKKDFGTPYDKSYLTVLQKVRVEKVSRFTDGQLMVHFENGMPFSIDRVVKVWP
jgi:hypothetical protein